MQPLSELTKLMCEYSSFEDSMRFSQTVFEPAEAARATKNLLCEPLETVSQVGLDPFCIKSPAPKVSS